MTIDSKIREPETDAGLVMDIRAGDKQALGKLVEKYDDDINVVLEEIEVQRLQWESDLKEIREKYRPVAGIRKAQRGKRDIHRKNRVRSGKGHFKQGAIQKCGQDRAAKKKGAFLMLNPDGETTFSPAFTTRSFKVFPNPASSRITVKFDANDHGPVGIEIHDDTGNLMRTIEPANNNGIQKQAIGIEGLRNGVYYISLIDKNGLISSKKFVVSNK